MDLLWFLYTSNAVFVVFKGEGGRLQTPPVIA